MKCSLAPVWIEPGEGKFVINDKKCDVYFPMLDQRAALFRPLSKTKALSLLDVNFIVKESISFFHLYICLAIKTLYLKPLKCHFNSHRRVIVQWLK